MSESVKLPESWGISARELCDHFAAWVRGELPVVGDVSVDVRLPTQFQRNTTLMIGADEPAGYLVGINARVLADVAGARPFVLIDWRGFAWDVSRFEAGSWVSSFGLTSRSGERFSIDLISAHRLYPDDVGASDAVILLQVHHIPRPIVPVVERRQQLGGYGFDDIQHALGKMEGRRWR